MIPEDVDPRELILMPKDLNPRESNLSLLPVEPTVMTPRETTLSVIPFEEGNFEPIPATAVEANFETPVDDPPLMQDDVAIAITRRKQSRLFSYHKKFGHLSFSILKLMAKAGHIPRELANVDALTCPGCAYGKVHRRPWRRKGIKNLRKIKITTAPGQVISVDQLVSPTVGFVPTHRGRLSLARYIEATVFVDHFSDFMYVHLMLNLDAVATVEAKRAFK